MKALDRQKLDPLNQMRSNIVGWRGQFTPEFIERRFTAMPESSIIPA